MTNKFVNELYNKFNTYSKRADNIADNFIKGMQGTSTGTKEAWQDLNRLIPGRSENYELNKFLNDYVLVFESLPENEREAYKTNIIAQLGDLFFLMGGGTAPKATTKAIAKTAVDMAVASKSGVVKAVKYAGNKIFGARNAAVKETIKSSTGKVKEAYNKAKETVENVIEKTVNSADDLTEAQDTITKLIKQNADAIKTLAREVGLTSKDELGRFIKFVKDTGVYLTNSPRRIAGKHKFKLQDTGLELSDIWNAYKQNGYTYTNPAQGAANLAGSMTFNAPGELLDIMARNLGYRDRGSLPAAAAYKIGLSNINPRLQEQYEKGMAVPGLSQRLPEYATGVSGRKYHVVGDQVYAYDTGRPVDVKTAIQDIRDGYNFRIQQARDEQSKLAKDAEDIVSLERSGYTVPQEVKDRIISKDQSLEQFINQLVAEGNYVNDPEYDSTGDLQTQYNEKVVQPEQAKQAEQQKVIQQRAQQQYDTAYAKIFQQLKPLVAKEYNDAVDRYFTSGAANVDYQNYMFNAIKNQDAVPLTYNQFINWKQQQAILNGEEVIYTRTKALLDAEINKQVKLYEQDIKRYGHDVTQQKALLEHERGTASNILKQLELQESIQHHRNQENLDRYKTSEYARRTDVQEGNYQLQRQNAPSQQFRNIAEGIAAVEQSGAPGGYKTILMGNPELGSQIFPAVQAPQQVEQSQSIEPIINPITGEQY